MSTEAIKYFKDDESLTINVKEKNGGQEAYTSREPDAIDATDGRNSELVERVEAPCLGNATKQIREYEIKKPEKKEPSLIKMISNKIKGDSGSRESLSSADNNSKLLIKETNNNNHTTNVKGNK